MRSSHKKIKLNVSKRTKNEISPKNLFFGKNLCFKKYETFSHHLSHRYYCEKIDLKSSYLKLSGSAPI